MIKKIHIFLTSISLLLLAPSARASFLFGESSPHIQVQHMIEPLNVSPITLNTKEITHLVHTSNMSMAGTLCAAAGAYLFATGIKHALCNNAPAAPTSNERSRQSWTQLFKTTLSSKYSHGVITSFLGITTFWAGLYLMANNEALLPILR